jgi:hypothetical protein
MGDLRIDAADPAAIIEAVEQTSRVATFQGNARYPRNSEPEGPEK